jgi:hypothetical protein
MEVDGREVSLTSTGRGSPPKVIGHMRGESLTKLEDWIYNSQSME